MKNLEKNLKIENHTSIFLKDNQNFNELIKKR